MCMECGGIRAQGVGDRLFTSIYNRECDVIRLLTTLNCPCSCSPSFYIGTTEVASTSQDTIQHRSVPWQPPSSPHSPSKVDSFFPLEPADHSSATGNDEVRQTRVL
jgi:hypothetical protein